MPDEKPTPPAPPVVADPRHVEPGEAPLPAAPPPDPQMTPDYSRYPAQP